MVDIGSKNELVKIIKQAEKDNNIERVGGKLFNSFCKSCKNDCRHCVGFDFACLLDCVISEYENGNGGYGFVLNDYQQSLMAYKSHIEENCGNIISPADLTCAIHAETDIDEVKYSLIDFGSVFLLSNDITEYFLNNKKSGRVVVDKIKIQHQIVKYIKRNIKASDTDGYKLVGLILTYCGLYAIITTNRFCHYDKIDIMVKLVVSVNDCVLFNKVIDDSSKFQPVESNNTVIFYNDQIEDLSSLRGFVKLGKCPVVK